MVNRDFAAPVGATLLGFYCEVKQKRISDDFLKPFILLVGEAEFEPVISGL